MNNSSLSRCVVVGGAPITNYAAVRSYLRPDDFIIFCDCGLRHMDGLGVPASLIIGDFDSHEKPETDTEIIVLPHKKDDTDSVYAVREALKRGYNDFLLIGTVGARFDHTMANISILLWLDSLGKSGMIVDDYSEMEIVSRQEKRIPDSYPYFSLVCLAEQAKGINIRNALYELQDGEITNEYQYGVSNEPLPGCVASVSVSDGRLLLIRDRP